MEASSSRPRTPLTSRLQSLLDGSSPRTSSESDTSNTDDARMWRAGTNGALRANRSSPSVNASKELLSHTSRQASRSSPNLLPQDLLQSASQLPIVRWFRGDSAPSSPTSSPSDTPSALRDALEDNPAFDFSSVPSGFQLQKPPAACLPDHMSGRTAVRRSPPFLQNLARSTMPTAAVTSPPKVMRTSTDSSLPRTASPSKDDEMSVLDISQSPPSRTSIDTLRRIRNESEAGSSKSPHGRSFSTSSPTRWWFNKERKPEVDELLDESDRADTFEGEEANMRKKYCAPSNPVVFCHGLLGFDNVQIGPSIAPVNVSHWRGIKEVLEARGIEVLITRVPATSSPMERAKVLESKVSEKLPGRSVHLIGHSMGGLDCRYLTTHLTERKFRVLSITTVATPHRGSSFADHFIATVGKQRLPSFVSLLDLLPNGGGDGKAFESLTLEAMRKFNEETPDVEGVKYYSWGAKFEPGLLDAFKWPHTVILEKEGPNDGLVSVASSQWGTYLGTLEDVNHLDLVGWISTARYKWAELTGHEIKFKPATFYLGVADHLARHAEGQTGEDEEDTRGRSGQSSSPKENDKVTPKNSEGTTETSQAGVGVELAESSGTMKDPR